MGKWHKTGCVLCAQNCGLEILVEENKMVKVRPDKENPRSQGYACRKGLNVLYHQYPKDRLTQPLKKLNNLWVDLFLNVHIGLLVDFSFFDFRCQTLSFVVKINLFVVK